MIASFWRWCSLKADPNISHNFFLYTLKRLPTFGRRFVMSLELVSTRYTIFVNSESVVNDYSPDRDVLPMYDLQLIDIVAFIPSKDETMSNLPILLTRKQHSKKQHNTIIYSTVIQHRYGSLLV